MRPHGGHQISVRPLTKEERKKNNKNLLSAMKPYKKSILLASSFIVVSTLLSIFAPQWLSKLTDTITEGAAQQTIDLGKIARIGSILIAFYACGASCNYLSSFIMAGVTQRFAYGMRKKISEKINRIPLSYYDARQYGDTLSIVTNDIDTVSQSMEQAVTMFLSSLFMLVGVLIAMFVTRWQMALTALLIVPIMLCIVAFITKYAMPQFRKRQIILGALDGKVEENFSGLTVIKAFGAGKRKKEEFEKCNQDMRKAMFRAQMISGVMQPLSSFVSYFAYAAVCVVGGLLLNQGTITYGTITAFLVYVNLFQSPMTQIAQAMNSLQMAAGAASRVNEFLAEKELSDESGKSRKLLLSDDSVIRGEVEFRNVRFGYDPEKIIIPDFSAKVRPGMKVAIVGPTGAGKTTMVNLLMRFYEVNGGDITIDGVSVKDMPREEIHDIFGMVLQDTWMFEGTLRENILFSKTGVSDEELENICREAGISHFVHTLPNGLDTYMDGEASVSGGQKQLITIARAMAEKAPLLILDEATSNVDTRTEEVIQQAMDRLTQGRTSFVIAHRLSTIRNADLILVMKDGNIIEQGTHDSLMALGGFYSGLYNSQFAAE
ncbi:MAG: ABC transporter ATP-binding protein [Candidatus Borkfalkiaceae bacterium]|nr:ABC transporter ATP-binding protein [Christensenellaceae bacterium]